MTDSIQDGVVCEVGLRSIYNIEHVIFICFSRSTIIYLLKRSTKFKKSLVSFLSWILVKCIFCPNTILGFPVPGQD